MQPAAEHDAREPASAAFDVAPDKSDPTSARLVNCLQMPAIHPLTRVTRLATGTIALAALPACGRSRDAADRPGACATPPVANPPSNIYAATGDNALTPAAARARPLVYVPNSRSASVSIIDPKTYRVIGTFPAGKVPQHVVPSWDLKTLWVLNNESASAIPIDPTTGTPGRPVPVSDPYNMYFTLDGKSAVVIAERQKRFDFSDPQMLRLRKSVPVRCKGLDHVDFTVDGRYLIATCEFSGELVKVDVQAEKVIGYLPLDSTGRRDASMPQDIRSSPDGRVFYVADMKKDGVFLVDPYSFKIVGFIHTGIGTHGITVGRAGRYFYVSNRGWHTTAGLSHGPGSISVLDPEAKRVVATWSIPGGGSPDMGNVTADGRELWLSGRYDREVYVFDIATGTLTHRIPVGREPHGLCVWPQPGRFSIGHTGNMR